MKERAKNLLIAAAREFENLRSPFDGDWLANHGVTLNECGDLSEQVANAIRCYVQLSSIEKARLLTMSLVEEMPRR